MDAMDVATCKNWSKIHKTELLLILASEKKKANNNTTLLRCINLSCENKEKKQNWIGIVSYRIRHLIEVTHLFSLLLFVWHQNELKEFRNQSSVKHFIH